MVTSLHKYLSLGGKKIIESTNPKKKKKKNQAYMLVDDWASHILV